MGNPFPKPFATQHKSGEIPEFSNPNKVPAPKRNLNRVRDSIVFHVHRIFFLNLLNNSQAQPLTPPSPCIGSQIIAAVFLFIAFFNAS